MFQFFSSLRNSPLSTMNFLLIAFIVMLIRRKKRISIVLKLLQKKPFSSGIHSLETEQPRLGKQYRNICKFSNRSAYCHIIKDSCENAYFIDQNKTIRRKISDRGSRIWGSLQSQFPNGLHSQEAFLCHTKAPARREKDVHHRVSYRLLL